MSGKVERFEDLELWQSAAKLAVDIYRLTEKGKLRTDYGMKDQLRRAASSVSNNIAEGFEYNNNPDFIRFLKYSKGSSGEVRNQLYLLREAGYIDSETYKELYSSLISLTRQIAGFIKYLKKFEQDKKHAVQS